MAKFQAILAFKSFAEMKRKVCLSSDMVKLFIGESEAGCKRSLILQVLYPCSWKETLASYLWLSDVDQVDADKIEEKLMAFTEGVFSAYAKLGRMRWASEAIDVYASNIQRLAELAKFEGSG